MKLLAFIGIALLSGAAAGAPFTCDQIKEKKVRAACVEAAQGASGKNVQAVASTEKEDANLAENKAALASFVQKSKERLTAKYKDPGSAQFTNLVVVTQNGWKSALCGSVNGKNSYGGYVGARKFFVHWWGDSEPEIWTEGASTEKYINSRYLPLLENAAKIRTSEAGLAELVCSKSALNDVMSIE